MKKYIFSLLIPLAVLAVVPVFANGQTTAPISARIQGQGTSRAIASNTITDRFGNSTTNYTTVFNLYVQAGDKDIYLNLPSSGLPAFSTLSTSVAIYKNGVSDNLVNYPSLKVDYRTPSQVAIQNGAFFIIPKGIAVNIPVSYTFQVGNADANTSYEVSLIGLNYIISGTNLTPSYYSFNGNNSGSALVRTASYSSASSAATSTSISTSTNPTTNGSTIPPYIAASPYPVTNSCYQFNTNMTIGSTGADVVALQTLLLANGHDIPSISSGAKGKGYFDSETQLAVMKYQNAKGIPNTGFVDL